MKVVVCEEWQVVDVNDDISENAIYGLFDGANLYRKIGDVTFIKEVVTGDRLQQDVHYQTNGYLEAHGLMAYIRVQHLTRTCRDLNSLMKLLALNPRRRQCFQEVEKLSETVYSKCIAKNVPICYHHSILKMVLEGHDLENAITTKETAAGFPFTKLVPYTTPILGSPLQACYQACEQEENRKMETDKSPLLASVNSSEHISRKPWGFNPGFVATVPMETFMAFNKKHRVEDRGTAFNFLLDYANGKIEEDDERIEDMGLPQPPFDGTSLTLLSEDGPSKTPVAYHLCDQIGLSNEWHQRTKNRKECCFNEIYVPDRPVTQLILDVDMLSISANTPLNDVTCNRILKCLAVGLAKSMNEMQYTKELSYRRVGTLHLFHRPDEAKLSARIVWVLPLHLCADLKVSAAVVKHFARKLTKMYSPLSQHVMRNKQVVAYVDPLTDEWIFYSEEKSQRVTIESGVDVATLTYKKSVRLPLCDKHASNRFLYMKTMNGEGLESPTPADFISNMAVNWERIMWTENETYKIEAPKSVDRLTVSVFDDLNVKLIKERLSVTYDVDESKFMFGGYYVSCSVPIFCHLHGRKHTRAKQFFTFNISRSPDRINQKCFRPCDKNSVMLTWSDGSYRPLTQDGKRGTKRNHSTDCVKITSPYRTQRISSISGF